MAYLQRVLVLADGPVNADQAISAGGDLPRSLVDGDSFQRVIVVIVDGLEENAGLGEDSDGGAGDICLAENTGRMSAGGPGVGGEMQRRLP